MNLSKLINIIILTIITFTVIIFFSACPDTTGGENDDYDDIVLLPPESVSASVDGDSNLITWSAAEGAEMYEILRNEGTGEDWEVIAENVTDTGYQDFGFSEELDTKYAVVSIRENERSELSKASNVLTRFVRNISATKLEYDNKIVIYWAEHTEANSYVVYRYDSKEDADPDSLTETTTNVFEDTTAVQGETYFYKVCWKQEGDNREYGGNVPFVFGIYDENIDYHEPNDGYDDITGQTESTVFNSLQPPYSYSFSDGTINGVVSDSDWYKYAGTATILTVQVTLPAGTVFKTDELRLVFYYDGEFYPKNSFYSLSRGNNYCGFDSYGFPLPSGTVEVYFKIYTVASSSRNILGEYEVAF